MGWLWPAIDLAWVVLVTCWNLPKAASFWFRKPFRSRTLSKLYSCCYALPQGSLTKISRWRAKKVFHRGTPEDYRQIFLEKMDTQALHDNDSANLISLEWGHRLKRLRQAEAARSVALAKLVTPFSVTVLPQVDGIAAKHETLEECPLWSAFPSFRSPMAFVH